MAALSMPRPTARLATTNVLPMNNELDMTSQQAMAQRGDRRSANHASLPDVAGITRRRFLEAAGFTVSLAALEGCGRAPTETALPFAVQPEGVVPGRRQSYASTCMGCPAACGLLASVRDGRPLKMEGMPEHPLSRGGLCAIGQALPIGLYDSYRLEQPLRDGKPSTWEEIDQAIVEKLSGETDAGTVRFVTSTVTSPTLQSTIDSFLSGFSDARHVVFDAVSCSAILDAHARTHGARVLPHYRLDQSDVIVSFGADFLGTWISPVEFTAAWSSRRAPTSEHPNMSYHMHFEGRMSLTGGNADNRIRLAPDEYPAVLGHLACKIATLASQPLPPGELSASPISDDVVDELAERLWNARGKSVVLCDSQDVRVQVLVNFINHVLGNYGSTVDIAHPSRQRLGNDNDILSLVDELKSGKVSTLFVAGVDLTHNLPNREVLAEALGKVKLLVSFAEREDDFASLAHFVCPDHHPLESWLDVEPVSGLVGLAQPTLAPLRNTRSILDSLSRWSGHTESAYDMIREYWSQNVHPRAADSTFQSFWDQAVHDGFVEVEPLASGTGDFQGDVVQLVAEPPRAPDYSLELYSKVGLTDSRHAHNPWLQELPDPVTKVTWDNYVSVSSALAEELDLADGDVVQVEADNGTSGLELPALIQPGQHDRVLAIALGYGVRGTDRFANVGPRWLESRPTVAAGELVGVNSAELIQTTDDAIHYVRSGVTLKKTGRRRDLASTQEHHSLEVPPRVAPHGAEMRHPIQQTTLSAFAENPAAGTPESHHPSHGQLWPEDHPKTGHWWGMVVDLNKCTGCSACLIACQSENNVPVVGKDEVRRQREMHWLRIDRYYSGHGDDIDVLHQPMMCQHCDNAPCETVCPVLATVHGEEGLNEQAYNRCVGTRYCANNCPYKVRRFNWFKYEHDDELQQLALNPDVTVRARGVMEKCSMCVQRIEEGKIEAKCLGQPVADGMIQTACQQSCPGQAIVFGDMNDQESHVHASLANPRRYRVLEEFNFQPSVAYLRVVKNRDQHDTEGGGHG